VRKQRSHAAARVALVIGSAALGFSPGAAAFASPAAAGRDTCRPHSVHSRACASRRKSHAGAHRHHAGAPRHHAGARTHASHGARHSTGAPRHGAPGPRRTSAAHTHAVKPIPAGEARAVAPSPAAAVASVLATACQNTEITPEAADLGLVREAVLCLINHVRAEHNEAPLKTSPELERAAAEHSNELVELDYFAHVSPSGLTPVQRIRETGYIPGPEFGYVIGENLAWGTLNLSTPRSIVNAWVASPGHLANILEAQYQETGIAVVAAVPPSLGNGQAGATYAQEFGVILE
jgi:uncharacterized protein YkwD